MKFLLKIQQLLTGIPASVVVLQQPFDGSKYLNRKTATISIFSVLGFRRKPETLYTTPIQVLRKMFLKGVCHFL